MRGDYNWLLIDQGFVCMSDTVIHSLTLIGCSLFSIGSEPAQSLRYCHMTSNVTCTKYTGLRKAVKPTTTTCPQEIHYLVWITTKSLFQVQIPYTFLFHDLPSPHPARLLPLFSSSLSLNLPSSFCLWSSVPPSLPPSHSLSLSPSLFRSSCLYVFWLHTIKSCCA